MEQERQEREKERRKREEERRRKEEERIRREEEKKRRLKEEKERLEREEKERREREEKERREREEKEKERRERELKEREMQEQKEREKALKHTPDTESSKKNNVPITHNNDSPSSSSEAHRSVEVDEAHRQKTLIEALMGNSVTQSSPVVSKLHYDPLSEGACLGLPLPLDTYQGSSPKLSLLDPCKARIRN